MNPRILGVGTAVTDHVVTQAAARELGERLFVGRLKGAERLMGVFESVQVRTRQVAQPLEWYEEPRPFADKNQVYARVALELSRRAADRAIERSGLAPGDIGGIVFVSSTGLAAPSLDSHLVQLLGLPRDVTRVPIWGMGCAGGGGGLGRASVLARGLGRPVLLVTVEICSATFVHEDRTRSNLIATALFGDGAAAAVIGPGEHGPEILAEHGQLFDDTEHVMGWDLVDGGLQVRFARTIPAIVRDRVPGVVEGALRRARVSRDMVAHWVLHPGGPKVLDAYASALGLDPRSLATSWKVLAEHGNMSSPTVLFVLEAYLAGRAPSGRVGLALGLGPGFCAEGIVFRW